MEFILIFIVPVFQIIFSVLRGMGKIKVPIGAIAILSIITGILLSAEGANLMTNDCLVHPHGIHTNCGMEGAMFFIGGAIIDSVAAILIGGICAIVYHQSTKNR